MTELITIIKYTSAVTLLLSGALGTARMIWDRRPLDNLGATDVIIGYLFIASGLWYCGAVITDICFIGGGV